MVQVRDLTELTLRDLWREVKGEGDWWGDLKVQTLGVVKRLLEGAMEEEILEQLRVDRYRRDKLRRGYHDHVGKLVEAMELGPRWLEEVLAIISLKDEVERVRKERKTVQEKLRRMAKAYVDGVSPIRVSPAEKTN